MNYQKGNILIDEFIGHIEVEEIKFDAEDLYYHISWDWLMMAVEKIKYTGLSGGITYGLRDALIDADIHKAYKEIILIIRWYNQNKKQ